MKMNDFNFEWNKFIVFASCLLCNLNQVDCTHHWIYWHVYLTPTLIFQLILWYFYLTVTSMQRPTLFLNCMYNMFPTMNHSTSVLHLKEKEKQCAWLVNWKSILKIQKNKSSTGRVGIYCCAIKYYYTFCIFLRRLQSNAISFSLLLPRRKVATAFVSFLVIKNR